MTAQPPWPDRFHIAPAKIGGYLLNPAHRDGGPKCRFLASFGFTPQDPGALFEAIYGHGCRANFRRFVPAHRAIKLYCEGRLTARVGHDPQVRTVWQMDAADASRTARFITLKPLSRPGGGP